MQVSLLMKIPGQSVCSRLVHKAAGSGSYIETGETLSQGAPPAAVPILVFAACLYTCVTAGPAGVLSPLVSVWL